MGYQLDDMDDSSLVAHYREMSHLPVNLDFPEGVSNLAFYQAICREICRRFAIRVENEELEEENDDQT